MSTIRAISEATINAPARNVDRYLVDFRNHHGRFLPSAFSDLKVESGGVGTGTVVTYRMRILGGVRDIRARVAEPQPGGVITETDIDTGIVTTFTVTPDGDRCKVSIETEWEPEANVLGFIERTIGPYMLRRVYSEELRLLDAYAQLEAR